jgi:amidase
MCWAFAVADILALDATAQLQALETGRISAVELLEATLRRHQACHPEINAVVTTDLERARLRARAIDEHRAKGDALGPLAGLPMTVKDTFDVEGMPASSGLKLYLGRHPSDAGAVARAKQADAVIWGKTNTPVLAGDWQTYNALYGTTNNPWNVERTTGGSSGGAAAALASRVTALEIGSDIGGSLRVPASFCGVFSHKPTWGMVSQAGHIPPKPGTMAERDLNVVGPMARSARDLRLLLSVLEQGPLAAKAPAADLKDLKVGLWIEEPGFALDGQVRDVIETFVGELAKRGVAIERVRPTDGMALVAAYSLLLSSVLAEDMPPATFRRLQQLRPIAQIARRFGGQAAAWAGQILARTATHAEWLAANEVRAKIGAQVRTLFGRVNVIIAPITPVTAFPHDQRGFAARSLPTAVGGKLPYLSMINWIALATACRLPATAVPAGLAADGLPVGVQIIGPRGGDSRTLAVAQAIEDEVGGFMPPPERT